MAMNQANPEVQADPALKARNVGMTIDSGVNITLGFKGHIQVPFNGTIFKWSLMADTAGSIEIDVLKDTYAAYPPFVGTSIVGTETPKLTSAAKDEDDNLTTWTKAVTAGDLLGFRVVSSSGIKRATLLLWMY